MDNPQSETPTPMIEPHEKLLEARDQTESAETLNERVKNHRFQYFLALWLVGVFNNNGYTLVQAAASDLARDFNQDSFMGLFLFFMIIFGASSRLVNGACCVNVRHLTRVGIVTVFTLFSFFMIAFACMNKDIPWFFWVAVASSIFNGISQSFGEAVFLGFLKGYPSYLVGDVSAGTGFAGPFASGTLLISKYFGLSSAILFFVEIPTIFIYFLAFKWLVDQKKKYRFVPEDKGEDKSIKVEITRQSDNTDAVQKASSNFGSDVKASEVHVLDIDDETRNNQSLNCTTIKSLLPRTFYLIFNLFSVYFLEYTIITSFADVMGQKMTKKYPDDQSVQVTEYFTILNFCYQIGVFISRSSLRFVSIPGNKIWILSLLQLGNFIFMFINAKFMYWESLYVTCPVLVWVGLMGGGSYVNVLHGILDLETLDKTEKEMALSLSLLFNDTGIFLAASLSLVLDNTILKVPK